MSGAGTASGEAPAGLGRPFLTLWAGQMISGLGTALGSFALGVWVFQQSHSATQLSLMSFTGAFASLLIGPYAGVIADRWDRRRLMIGGNVAQAVVTLIVASLLHAGLLRPWHAYPVNALMTGFGTLAGPALLASVSLLVPRGQLARASGMAQLAAGMAQLVGPLLAGVLVGVIGFDGVILLDFLSFFFAIAAMAAIRIPRPPAAPREPGGEHPSFWREAMAGWRYLRDRPGLFALLKLFALTNFALAMVQVLLTPLVLGFATPVELGKVSSAGAAGVLIGGLVLSLTGGPQRRVWGIFMALVGEGLILLLGGLRPSVALVSGAAFVFMLTGPFVYGCSQAIWQSKVATAIQGRVFGMRQIVSSFTQPLAFLLAGPLADRVFEPLLAPQGTLAPTVGRVIGTGPGRGIGFLFIALGLLILASTLISFTNPRLRHVEEELPDALGGPEGLAAEPAPG